MAPAAMMRPEDVPREAVNLLRFEGDDLARAMKAATETRDYYAAEGLAVMAAAYAAIVAVLGAHADRDLRIAAYRDLLLAGVADGSISPDLLVEGATDLPVDGAFVEGWERAEAASDLAALAEVERWAAEGPDANEEGDK